MIQTENKEKFSIAKTIAEVIKDIGNTNVLFEYPKDSNLSINGPKDRFKHALLNVLQNSINAGASVVNVRWMEEEKRAED